jgi:outer membrane receptor protein involved in Fe transport
MKNLKSLLFTALLMSITVVTAQNTISGKIVDQNDQAIPGVNILLGENEGTVTDFDGNFTITINGSLPVTVEISSIGFESQQVVFNDGDSNVTIQMQETLTQLEEIVIAASRTPERIAESPVSIERIGIQQIRRSSSPDFYNSLENLKGVDVNYSAIGFPSVNTRGFASFANTRFLQLVDGMDNAAPGLNFSVGNLLGLNELDVASVELLPGASSALYGANAFNGILFMRSKNPFDYEGVNVYAKTGINSSSNNGDNQYYDFAIRAAKKFSDKFAAKINVSHYQGKEWAATDEKQYTENTSSGISDIIKTRNGADLSFNGLNLYGDEITNFMPFGDIASVNPLARGAVQGAIAASLGIPASFVPESAVTQQIQEAFSGTAAVIGMDGYSEMDLYNGDATSTKVDISLHLRPFNDNTEFIWTSKFGGGNSIYQGASRYALKNFMMQQHKLELRGDNFFIRGYTTIEDSGDAYDMVNTGIMINAANATDWFTTYAGTFINSVLTGSPSHSAARQAANAILPQPGSAGFQTLFDKVITTPLYTGSKFTDNTKLYHFDGNYNFKNLISFADIQVGASYRQYSLNSEGSIFTDRSGAINYSEYGVYTQLQKQLFQDKLKFTGSLRYDGAQNFNGNFSPRLSLVLTPDEGRKHNFRASFQTGFRYPTTQNQYIGLETPIGTLLGAAPDNYGRFTSTPRNNNFSAIPEVALIAAGIAIPTTLSGLDARDNSFTLQSVQAFSVSQNPADLKKAVVKDIEPEEIVSYEFGYRGLLGSAIFLDVSFYVNEYKNFIAANNVIAPNYGDTSFTEQIPGAILGSPTPVPASIAAIANSDFTVFSITSNSEAIVTSKGFNIGLDTKIAGADFGISYTYSDFDFDQDQYPDFEAGFNTAKNRFKASLAKENVIGKFGYGINWRYNDAYLWEASFADAMIPSRNIIDTQIQYTTSKSTFKIGAANLTGVEYVSGPGTGTIGSTYFVGWTFNP